MWAVPPALMLPITPGQAEAWEFVGEAGVSGYDDAIREMATICHV